ncbi:MAG: NUDIX domain-containing protein [Clostridia bacterium]|nr:NUDIX domain-containing protein [Clostridia bacterium]
MAEKWDLLDADRIPTGEVFDRKGTIIPGQLHTVVHICIFNENNELLVQHRVNNKACWGGKWDLSAGGSALSGETSRQAAHREVKEELGLDIDFNNRRPHLTVNFDCGFDDNYIVRVQDLDLSALILQKEEVQNVRFAPLDEILAMIEDGSFVPYRKNYIRLLFDFANEPAFPVKTETEA